MSSKFPNHRFCVAPMLDWTDKDKTAGFYD